jgi:hypothetical protein
VRLPVQGLPRYRFEAHRVTVKPQQWMRSTTSRVAGKLNAPIHPLEVRLDVGDPGRVDPPWLLDVDMLVEVPQDALLARTRDHRPSDDRPAKLLMHRIGGGTSGLRGAAFGVVMQELAVCLVTECGIPCGAEDKAVPRLIDGMRRHSDDLLVTQRGRAAPQPLPQTFFDEFARLPRARLEHSGRQVERCDYGIRSIYVFPSAIEYADTLFDLGKPS